MGFAEIQAAFAAQAAGQPAPAAPTLAPSPFAPLPFQPAAQTPAAPGLQAPAPIVQPPPAGQTAFTFTPPAGAPTGPAAAPPGTGWPPINPPGERAPLAVSTLAAPPAPAAPSTGVQPDPAPTGSSALPEAEPPKRRRSAKRQAIVEAATQAMATDAGVNLAAEGAAVAQLPADGSTVEDIVQELFARGVSSVHLTFSREDGK
jgi:hypothetical protein